MKIIHTSDWHLGHRFYDYDRTEEEERFFAQLAKVVAEERADALVVSGDVYHTGAPGNDVAKRFTDRLLEVQAGSPATEVVVIAGNHDSSSRLEVDRTLWMRSHVRIFGTSAETAEGRADFEKNVVELPGKGFIAAVPFCHERNFPAVAGTPAEDRMAAYFSALEAYLRVRNDQGLPSVLMAHLAVGKETDFTGQDRGLVIGGEASIEVRTLGTGYDYIALGHIHCPQWVKGERKVARYCGTPRAIHFDETYPHGVDVVEIASGREPVVRTIAFEPLRKVVTVGGKEGKDFSEVLQELEAARLEAGTYVRLNVALKAGEVVDPEWTERARTVAMALGLRFCQVNTIRSEEERAGVETSRLSMEELKALTDDDVVNILGSVRELTVRQKNLLLGLMKEMKAAQQNGEEA